tara:strand:+ start:17 stop:1006 length:990 start_codon:yes stop_codon:yes gene_type:complete
MNLDIYVFLLSLLTFLLIDRYKKKIYKSHFLDQPNLERKIHKFSTYLIGGHFIFILFITSCIFELFFDNNIISLYFAFYCIFAFLIGVIDDLKDIRAELKLFLLLVAYIFLTLLDKNFLLAKVHLSFINKTINFGIYSYFISALFILLLINAINLIDGINGLAMMIFIIWSSFLYYYLEYNINYFFIFFYIIIFLKIYKGEFFLGNSGSLLIGSIIGLQSISLYNDMNQGYPSENIFILFFFPGLDMFRLFVQRILNKKNPFKGDNLHLHHMLSNKLKLYQVLIIYFLIITISSYFAFNDLFSKIEITLFLIGIYFFLILFFKKKLVNF